MKQNSQTFMNKKRPLKLFISCMVFSFAFIFQMQAQSSLVPSDLLNAWNSNTVSGTTYPHCDQWKITYPTGVEDKTLCGEDNNEFFYVNSTNDGIVFFAPVRSNNGTTPNSTNIRSELRERAVDGDSDEYWTTEGRHVIYVEQAITHLPINTDELVATQIHGDKSAGIDDALVVRLENKHLFLSFNGGNLRSNVTITNNYTLGTKHEVIFEVLDDKHYVYYSEDGNLKSAYQNGNASSYLVKDGNNEVLMDLEYDKAYFKVGNYTQSNPSKEGSDTDDPDNYGEVVVYDMYVDHNDADEVTTPTPTTCNANAPTELNVTNVTTTEATLNWDIDSNVDHYNVRYRKNGNSTWITESSISAGSVNLTALTSGTTYEWQVRAKCADGNGSDYSDAQGTDFTTNDSTTENPSTETCSDAPTGLLVSNLASDSATLNWDFNSSVDHYNLRYKKTGDSQWRYIESIHTDNVLVTDVNTSSSYEWQIRAKCADGSGSDYTDGQGPNFTPTTGPDETIDTPTTETCSDTPTGLLVSNLTSNSATLNWDYNTNVDHYNLRYKKTGDSQWRYTESIHTDNVLLTDVNTSSSYEWQIRAKCSDGSGSDYTDGQGPDFTPTTVPDETTDTPTTEACNDTPTGLFVSNLTSNSATLNWDLNSSVDHYNVRYKKTGDSDWRYKESIHTNNVLLTDVNTSSSYEWQIRAKCSDASGSDYTDGQGPDFTPTKASSRSTLLKNNNLSTYPNPFKSSLSVKVDDIKNVEETTIKIYNAYGRLVYEKTNINTNNKVVFDNELENGMYLIILINKQGNILESKKIMKN
ncbi:fibronectin type III domain-containing protein [Winogradskyella undariae]|uniref:fibronectin type III domain-containing protein n=1 Tax=Winogradskyella undariae TaxID=1285465 RepID=UPI0015C9ED5D|nr:fibronectin type III domain-containing protein [Winogradskyella undariae]